MMPVKCTEKEEFMKNLVVEYIEGNINEDYKDLQGKQQIELAKTIAELVKKYKEREEIECIYLWVIDTGKKLGSEDKFYVFLVTNGDVDKLNAELQDYKKNMDKEHSKKFGGLYSVIPIGNIDYKDVSVGIIDVPEHTEWTKDMIVAQELLLSEILYDKTGEYGKIKEAANKQYDPKKVKDGHHN